MDETPIGPVIAVCFSSTRKIVRPSIGDSLSLKRILAQTIESAWEEASVNAKKETQIFISPRFQRIAFGHLSSYSTIISDLTFHLNMCQKIRDHQAANH